MEYVRLLFAQPMAEHIEVAGRLIASNLTPKPAFGYGITEYRSSSVKVLHNSF
jgi:hypothetical protein